MPSFWKHEQPAVAVLYREFLFRIVEMESLSSKADVAKLFGQIASVLLTYSLIEAIAALLFMDGRSTPAVHQAARWGMEYELVSLTFLVAGLFSALSWDAFYPIHKLPLCWGRCS